MRKLILVFYILALIPSLQVSSQDSDLFTFPAECNADDYLPGRVIVKFHADVKDRAQNSIFVSLLTELKAESFFQKFPYSPVPEKKENELGLPLIDLSGIYEICFNPETSLEYFINRLIYSGLFEYVYPHYIEQVLYTPNDPNIGSQYYLTNIKAYQAWDICKSDTTRVVAITDTGIEFNHP
ncbi:MAG TPA: hypothetical protein PLA88_06970, partial [Bacteroidales bacterium]|nr:hypothetical protein [Bacteroidales bacterium]